MKEPWQREYDSWLDNYGNPGIQEEESDEMDFEFAEQTFGVDLACGHTVYGKEADIDSGIRKHNDYCEVAQEMVDREENGTGNVSANDEKDSM